MNRCLMLFNVVLLVVVCVAGCSDQTSTTKKGSGSTSTAKRVPIWTLAIEKARDAGGWALELVHDGSGWMLGKSTVTIEQVGDTREENGEKYADFKITVTSSDETFESTVHNVECDEFGIPSDAQQQKFDEAVDKIKNMLSKLQD